MLFVEENAAPVRKHPAVLEVKTTMLDEKYIQPVTRCLGQFSDSRCHLFVDLIVSIPPDHPVSGTFPYGLVPSYAKAEIRIMRILGEMLTVVDLNFREGGCNALGLIGRPSINHHNLIGKLRDTLKASLYHAFFILDDHRNRNLLHDVLYSRHRILWRPRFQASPAPAIPSHIDVQVVRLRFTDGHIARLACICWRRWNSNPLQFSSESL